MRITRANSKAVKYACMIFHYAHAVPVNTIGYNIFNDKNEWCGVVLFGTGANNHIASPYGMAQGEVLELVRVALNGKQETTSMAVSYALRELKKDAPMCKLVVSYADADQGHFGTIYQATNWIYTGIENVGSLGAFIINGKKTHPKSVYSIRIVDKNGIRRHCPQTLEAIKKYLDPNATEFYTQGKRKYLFPMNKKIRRQIVKLAKPYPKKEIDNDNDSDI